MPYAMGKAGEAVAVELGQRGLLFAVLVGANGDQGYWEMLPERVIAPALGVYPRVTRDDADRLGVFQRLLERTRGEKVDLPFDNLPMLVRFRDIADPQTIERVDSNDLPASFGPGVKLMSATIEITDDPVNRGLEERMPWLRAGNWFDLPGTRDIGPSVFVDGAYLYRKK